MKELNFVLTFDFDAESAEIRRNADKPVRSTKGQYGPRKGLDRILNLLREEGVLATFFVPGWVADTYPSQVKAIFSEGHEVASHGYLHENLNELKEEDEKVVLQRSMLSLQRVVGRSPLGFRAPHWELSWNTLTILAELGYVYDSSLMNDDSPYTLKPSAGRRMIELPVDWLLDDWIYFETERRSISDVFEVWSTELDSLLDEGGEYFLLTMHPQVMGRASRVGMLRTMIRHARKSGRVRFVTASELCRLLGDALLYSP